MTKRVKWVICSVLLWCFIMVGGPFLFFVGLDYEMEHAPERVNPSIKEVNNYLHTDFKEKQLIEGYDSHGGLHGDGETFAVIQTQGFKRLPHWNPILKDCPYYQIRERIADSRSQKILFPEVTEGYYYFYNCMDSDEISNRYSIKEFQEEFKDMNYVVALYDKKSQKLYFYLSDS